MAEVRVKPDWKGWAWFVGPLAQVGEHAKWTFIVWAVGIAVGLLVSPLWGWAVWIPSLLLALLTAVVLARRVPALLTDFFDNWVWLCGGITYAQRGRDLDADPLDISTRQHESIHAWLEREHWLPVLGHAVDVAVSAENRLHNEGMAYGYEVGVWGRPFDEVVDSLMKPMYNPRWSREQAETVVRGYAEVFRKRRAEYRAAWPS